MSWKTIEISKISDLLDLLISYESGWIFRGQAQADWELQSTLERLLFPIDWDPDLAKSCEEYSLHQFQSRAYHYISRDSIPTTKLGWLSIMQHHGIPTRLLDFTESPFMALFFAFDSVSPAQRQPCSIWAIEYRRLMKDSVEILKSSIDGFNFDYSSVQMQPDLVFDQYVDLKAIDILWVTEPKLCNFRLERQKGTFLLTGNIQKRIGDLLPSALPPESAQKIVISAELANEAFRILTSMGIDNSRLFADIDGFARDIKRMLMYQVPYKYLKVSRDAKNIATN